MIRRWSNQRSAGSIKNNNESTKIDSVKTPKVTKTATENEKIAQAFLDRLNDHVNFLSLFHPRADVVFPEATMAIADYQEEQTSAEKAFPDFRLDFATAAKEQPDGSVVVNVYGHGTHTGEPYGFGPYPVMEAKGVYCRNDPEKLTFIIKDGKISRLTFEPTGELSGPPGFYVQIGGIIF